VATNALLERRGVPTVLVTNRGFGDLFEIGTQERPELFALRIEKRALIHAHVVEVAGRVGPGAEEIEPLETVTAGAAMQRAQHEGAESVAIVLLHATRAPRLEDELADLARQLGFAFVSTSHDAADEIGFLARGETTLVDAYLTPLLQRHVTRLREWLPGSSLRFMQSSGGLAESQRFRGSHALLSGPAGGVVGAARVAAHEGFARAIGFDMGGTSTDVSLVERGEVARRFESMVGGVRIKAPMLAIHTIAAGGGSICQFDGFRFSVGPESAGADPGPLCYGLRDTAGRVKASKLTLTDVNYFLGRIQPDHFPFSLDPLPGAQKLEALRAQLATTGQQLSLEQIAAGFVEVANKSMAQAIERVSVARGVDPRTCALVGFGGAAGQHVTAVARELGIRTILLHPLAGVLSAYGIGLADATWDDVAEMGCVTLPEDFEQLPEAVATRSEQLRAQGVAVLEREGFEREAVRVETELDLRYAGTETALTVPEPRDGGYRTAFEALHRAHFGYLRPGRRIEIVALRVRARVPAKPPASLGTARRNIAACRPRRFECVWFPGIGRVETPIFEREELAPGQVLEGPALLLDPVGTVLLDPGFRATFGEDEVLRVTDVGVEAQQTLRDSLWLDFDPIRLEVFRNRFSSIAEQMGEILRKTAVSTNIKERLDFSCAVFDETGGLVANAPHIPVHLGAMSETVRAVRERFSSLAPGDAVVTNDPRCGGSHLPDITVVSPVFLDACAVDGASSPVPILFVASRGHHADIGGKQPGSMPADSHRIEEEGIVLEPFKLVAGGVLDEVGLRARLRALPYPARNPDDNLADIEAMLAANRCGEQLLVRLVDEVGKENVSRSMRELQESAAAKVREMLARFPEGRFRFEDRLDDGSKIAVQLEIVDGGLRVDFAGTAPASAGNRNAPRAVVCAALLYVLRSLLSEPIPLNGGCLAPVELRIPEGSLLDPPEGAAVVGGNVETSQRIVDVLLGALGVVAASQGTMNNVSFGNAAFGYYETLGGGAGAGEGFAGASGVHTHMTNTRITDPEVLENRYPVRLERFALRRESGGQGCWRGGDGLVRRYRFLAPVEVSLLTERRATRPYGLAGGGPGQMGRNLLVREDGTEEVLPGSVHLELEAGTVLQIETPGGGGFGESAKKPCEE